MGKLSLLDRACDKFGIQNAETIFRLLIVKLVIVHFHLRPGGIRRVIELATPHLLRKLKSVRTVVLACGEADDAKWNRQFAELIQPAQLEIHVDRSFGYVSEQRNLSRHIQRRVGLGLTKLLADADPADCLVWAHNLGIGRNLLLARELARVCAAQNIPLVSHHHDWWFDNRWRRWPEIRKSGFRSLAAVAETIFPPNPKIRHVGINAEDATLLREGFPVRAAWLPNPVPRQAPPRRAAVRAAADWLERTLREHGAPFWILPCRLLRRKNVAEALLLARWLRPEAWLVTTGGASSADEQHYFRKLEHAAHQHHWRLRLGVLQGDETNKPSVPELLAASEAVLLTSIQEGFGLPYLEAAAASRPLIARNLSNVAPDLRKFGFRLPQAYDEIFIAPELFDWKAERARQKKLFARWHKLLPVAVRKLAATPHLLRSTRPPTKIAFSRLTLTAQLEVLAQPRQLSWEKCAPLNPFLEEWQQRAAAGKLELTPWPARADHWLSGETYARKLVQLTRAKTVAPPVRTPHALQTRFVEKKLCAANLYPLLWATET